jgi:hypothetical protein
MAFAGGAAWVINHRDRVLRRIDLATNGSAELVNLGGDAPERMVWSRGSLWGAKTLFTPRDHGIIPICRRN